MEDFVDAHCHFDAHAFAEYAGAGCFICNGTHPGDWGALMHGVVGNAYIIPALGLHPWYVDTAPTDWAARLREMLVAHQNAMVGEVGLDRSRGNMDAQYSVFVTQYKMAAQLGRPIHIHCVRAWDIMLHVIKTLPRPPVIVAHRFSGTPGTIAALCRITDNIYFSYRAATGPRTRAAIAATPLSRILVETDGNAPAPDKIADTIREIASVRGLATSEMADIIYENSLRVIKNGQTTQNQNVNG